VRKAALDARAVRTQDESPQHVSRIIRQPLPLQNPSANTGGLSLRSLMKKTAPPEQNNTPPPAASRAGLSLRNLTKKKAQPPQDADSSEQDATSPDKTASSEAAAPMTVGEMRAAAANDDEAAGSISDSSAPATPVAVSMGTRPPSALSNGGGMGVSLSLRNLMRGKTQTAPITDALDESAGATFENGGRRGAAKTFAEETAEMTAGKTVGDVGGAAIGLPKSAWALPKYVTKRVTQKNLTPAGISVRVC